MRPALPWLHALRGISCLAVMATHMAQFGWIAFPPGLGTLSVAVFLALSGFLMALLHLPGEWDARYWLRFLWRRGWRIYPAFICAVALLWGLGFVPGIEHQPFRVMNFPISWRSALEVLALKQSWWHFWTVDTEIKCYLLLPFYGCMLLSLPARFRLPVAAAAWVAFLWLMPREPEWVADRWDAYALFFGGVTAGLSYRALPLQRHRAWEWLALWCILAGIVYGSAEPDTFRHTAIVAPLVALGIFAAALARPLRHRALTPLMIAGDISFSLYLLHPLLFLLTYHWLGMRPWAGCVAALSSIAAATFLYHAVEKPGMAIGKLQSQSN